MATFTANVPVDPSDLNFEDFDGGVFSNDDATQSSEFLISGIDGGVPFTVTVDGHGFLYANDPDHGEVPFAGTIESIHVVAGAGPFTQDVFTLEDISVSVGDVLAVASTHTLNDDFKLIEKMFKGDDILNGSSGDDILAGFDGNDTFDGGGGADQFNGNRGNDAVSYQSSGQVTIDLSDLSNNTGDAAGDVYNSIRDFIGSKKADDITGDDNDNRIDGGGGKDHLHGGGGDDNFEFSSKLARKAGPTIDDYTVGHDRLLLSKDIFTEAKEDGDGVIPRSFFVGAKAHDADDRFIYNDLNGKLFYDADGSGDGAKKLVVHLTGDVELTRVDLELI